MEPLCGGVFRPKTGWAEDEYCVNKGSPSTYPGPYGDAIGSWGHTFPTDSGYDLWHRQGYTLYDLVGMCVETEGCECVQVDNVESGGGYSNGRKWSMHRSTATA